MLPLFCASLEKSSFHPAIFLEEFQLPKPNVLYVKTSLGRKEFDFFSRRVSEPNDHN
jgi:hypothetical protein